MEKIIQVKGVSYDYKLGDSVQKGVENIDLDIYKGEFLTLLGHNGSGKSTLAKLLNAFLLPDKGSVISCGFDTADEANMFEIRKNVGMVFQNPDSQMVASIIEDDLAFGPENLGIEPEEIARRVDWALEAVQMSEYRKHTPFKLSGGQKQRIAIAGILAMLPKVLILDESTSMLDPRGRREVLNTVQRLNREMGMTVVLITHYMDEAIESDRVAVMYDGKILKVASPREIFEADSLLRSADLMLPVAGQVSLNLKQAGYRLERALTDEELAESICLLKSGI
ncbi:MAG: energy-coupling factor transporter ATPase [Christensenellales bacterium]|jgi:energy-coupling factor transport system ATP-binding protein